MPTLSRITFSVSRDEETEIKRKAKATEAKSISQFCREKILSDAEPDTLDRVSVEAQIDRLSARIEQLEASLVKLGNTLLALSNRVKVCGIEATTAKEVSADFFYAGMGADENGNDEARAKAKEISDMIFAASERAKQQWS